MAKSSFIDQLKQLEKQRAELTTQALKELFGRLSDARATVVQIEEDIRILGGEVPFPFGKKRGPKAARGPGDGTDNGLRPRRGRPPGKGKKAKKAAKGSYKDIDKPTLVSLLKKADGKTMARKQLNAAGYNLISAIGIAKDDKSTFSFEKNGAQGSVTLKS